MIRKLNIVTTYPVKWSIYKVMRDFIQNFFDATGPDGFKDKFIFEYNDSTLRMYTEGSVELDLFCYMGVSTKRTKGARYAGRFGEGFKVASLVAWRDFGISINMASSDWSFDVTEDDIEIDGNSKKSLAYDIKKRKDDGLTILTLSSVTSEYYEAFCKGRDCFIYNGHPDIGRLIASTECGEIYETQKKGGGGKVFLNYQCRYIMERYPFIVSNHTYSRDGDDRDREYLYDGDALKCTMEIVSQMSPGSALEMLELLKDYWSADGKGHLFSLDRVIRELTRIISFDPLTVKIFTDKYKASLVAGLSSSCDYTKNGIAKSWFVTWENRSACRVVRPCFKRLGVMNIIDLCEENDGFSVVRKPNDIEAECIKMLSGIANEQFADLLCYEVLPECNIIVNERTHVEGYASARKKVNESVSNAKGLIVKMEIHNINLKRSLFTKDGFPGALSTYMHELLHEFGTDLDSNFHMALKLLSIRMIETLKEIENYENKWTEIFSRE